MTATYDGDDTPPMTTTQLPGLLAGVKVVDLSTYVTGPYAAMMLADLGADVIKVEPPGGDPNRRVGRSRGGTAVLFAAVNHGKRSIMLDLKQPDDAAVLRGLIRWADVMLENWRPGAAERLGLGDAALEALNPCLVHVNVTGWGTTGPWSARPAFDGLMQAFGGVAWSAGRLDEPSLLRFYLADKVTGVYAAQAAMAGLVRAGRSRRGERIEVNMLDANAYFNFPDVFSARLMVDDDAVLDPEVAPATKTLVHAADGCFVLSPASGAHIRSLCEAMDHPEWLPEFKQTRTFDGLAPLIQARMESVTMSHGVEHWVDLLAAHDVPAAPVLDLDQHLAHPQVEANRTYGESDHEGFGRHRVARHPARAAADNREGAPGTFPDLDADGPEIRRLAAAFTP